MKLASTTNSSIFLLLVILAFTTTTIEAREFKKVYYGVSESAIKYHEITTELVENVIQTDMVPVMDMILEKKLLNHGFVNLQHAELSCEQGTTTGFHIILADMDGLDIVSDVTFTPVNGMGPQVRPHDYKAW